MPRYLVEFHGEREIEAASALDAELDAIQNFADEHVRVIEFVSEENERGERLGKYVRV